MKRVLVCVLYLGILVLLTGVSHATCSSATPDHITVTSFTLAPNVISGDESQFATGTIQACVPSGSTTGLILSLWGTSFTATKTICDDGYLVAGGCTWPNVGTGSVTVTFSTNGYNYGTTDVNGIYSVQAYGEPTFTNALTVTAVGWDTDPGPDGPCPYCGAGRPINVSNGDTWITQQDYSVPGLAGGLTLTRNWNSLWPNINPPETVGIFGDSWRSNFEERIKVLGLIATFWKGDGSRYIYAWDSLTSAYYLSEPLDESTTLSFNSTTNVWTSVYKNGTQKTFDSNGYLTSITDRNGNTVTIAIDSAHSNRISTVTDAAGRVLTFNYANSSFPRLCTSISDSVGTFTQYQYDSSSRLIQVVYPDSSQYNFYYTDPNSNTLISLVTDSSGATVEAHSYDSNRRGVTSDLANDGSGNPVSHVHIYYSTPNPWQRYVCDSTGGNCTTVQIASRAHRHYISKTTSSSTNACSSCGFGGNGSATFDEFGYTTSSTDGNGHTSYYTYDSQGNMTAKALPAFYTYGYNIWHYTYNSFGQVLTVTDPLGAAGDPNHTTVNTYDTNGNLLTTTTPSPDGGSTLGSVTTFTYNTNGTLATITDPLSNVTTLAYYSSGLVHTVTDAASNVTTYAYDSRGNRTSVTDAASHVTQFQYDAMNRVTQITYPDSTTVQFGYDGRGRRTSVTDQNGKVTAYAYDDADRLTSVTDAQTPTAGVTTYGYDRENDLTDIWDASGHHTQFLYYPGQYLYETIFPSGYTESYSWDANNNLTYKTDRNGNPISYYYDYQNHLYYKSQPYTGYIAYHYYDPAGRLTEVTDYNTGSTGDYNFTYDNMNRLTAVSADYNFDSVGAYTVQYGYDAASNRTSMIDPQSVTTTYGYDALNRLTSLANSWAGTFGFGYDALSRRTSLTRPNSVDTSYSYDSLSRLLSVLHQYGSTTLDGASYTYDNAGNRLTKTDQRTSTTSNYTYDAIYQLSQVTQGGSTTESYSYDLVGNRLSSLGASPYSYNSSNELTSTPSATYTYDYNGNTKTKVDSSGTTTYNWDAENRLTSVVLPASGGTVYFKYDPFGRRVQKSGPGGTTNYIYDGMGIDANVIEEADNSGTVLARFGQGPGIDRPLAEFIAGATSYYQQDGLGSITSLSSSGGALANTYTYDSYGKLATSTGTLTNPFQFTGRGFDPETQLYFYRARYYDDSMGRFINEDPGGFDGGNDFYAYVKNNPVIWIDPLGLAQCTYNIAAHHLHCVSDDGSQSYDTTQARSGRGLCMNNMACVQKTNQGPIPPGNYGMGPMGGTPNPHKVPRVWLTPLNGTITFDRKYFEVHQGNDNSSAGCIVLDPDAYNTFMGFYAIDNSGRMGVQ